MQLKDKLILITGASGGIGEELAEQLADEKCRLALMARRGEKLLHVQESLRKSGADVSIFKCDVSNHSEVKKTIKDITTKLGNVDIAILNAGVSLKVKQGRFDSTNAEDTFDTNVLGMVYCFEELLPGFIERKGGVFIGVSSLADARGFPENGFYCASKAAATLFLESQRISLKKYGIKVITVKPGFVKTPMTEKNRFPMPFLMDVDRAASIIIKGIKKEKKIIQFPWQTVLGTKFLKILPDAIFEYIALKNIK